jgi:hypothetical protein
VEQRVTWQNLKSHSGPPSATFVSLSTKKNMFYKGTVLLAMEKREEWLLLYSEPRADSMESTQATAHNAVLKPLGDVN